MEINKATTLAKILLIEFGLKDWTIDLNNAKKRFGYCRAGTKTIGLSKPLIELNKEEIVKDTILHEIAHALVGAGHGHNLTWKRKAIEIGCNGKRCYGDEVTIPKGKYTAICHNCGKETQRHKKGRDTACGRCCRAYNGGRYDPRYKLEFKKNY